MKSGSLAAIVTLLVCLALTIPATASNTVDFSNAVGRRSGINAGLSLSESTLTAITGLNGGNMIMGTFSGPVTWTLATLADGTHNYTLTGVVTGMMGGTCVDAVAVQLTSNIGRGYFLSSSLISGGSTSISSVPEPSTIALFVTGSVTMLGMIRRRPLSSHTHQSN